MKIISLNTWQSQQKEALDEYFHATKQGTDIFLFQEADEGMEELRREHFYEWQSLTARKYESFHNEEFVETTIFQNDFNLVAAGSFFQKEENQGSGLWTELVYKNETYIICNIHGTSSPAEKVDSEARIAQTKEILAFLQDKPGKHIIMGDFNLFPDTESVRLFEEAGYRNLIKEYAIDTTRNRLAWEKYPDNKHLFADYTFVSKDVQVEDFQVPKNEISDHLPMELTIG